MYRKGPLRFAIVPNGWKGWSQFCAWLALLVPIFIAFSSYAEKHPTGSEHATGVFLFMVGLAVWIIGGIWWVAEWIDVVEVLHRKQQA